MSFGAFGGYLIRLFWPAASPRRVIRVLRGETESTADFPMLSIQPSCSSWSDRLQQLAIGGGRCAGAQDRRLGTSRPTINFASFTLIRLTSWGGLRVLSGRQSMAVGPATEVEGL